MVLISARDFTMGLDHSPLPMDGEGPAIRVHVDAFLIDRYEVSNAAFARFVAETKYQTEAEGFGDSFVAEYFLAHEVQASITKAVQATPWWLPVPGACWHRPEGLGSNVTWRPTHPVVHVSWHDAIAFCAWRGARLPTEAEWEGAARCGHENRTFWWGEDLHPDSKHMMNVWQGQFPLRNTAKDGYAAMCPVDAFPPNPCGLHNILGNVWEWVHDTWRVPRLPTISNPKGPASIERNEEKVKKGGSFMCHKSYCYRYRLAARSQNTADSSAHNLGFRCARDV